MSLSGSSLIRLSPDHSILPFDCGDEDLNDYLSSLAKPSYQRLVSVTYLFEKSNKTIAFFSVANDKISLEDIESKTLWKTFMPHTKRLKSYPAVKIGRLGVHSDCKTQGIGTAILDYIKELFITNNRTGCKFITVDAYDTSVKFYEKNGFKYFSSKDQNEDTRQMYFDLLPYK